MSKRGAPQHGETKLKTKDLPDFCPCVYLPDYPSPLDTFAWAEKTFEDAGRFAGRVLDYCNSGNGERAEFDIILLAGHIKRAIERGRELIATHNENGMQEVLEIVDQAEREIEIVGEQVKNRYLADSALRASAGMDKGRTNRFGMTPDQRRATAQRSIDDMRARAPSVQFTASGLAKQLAEEHLGSVSHLKRMFAQGKLTIPPVQVRKRKA